MLISTRVYIHGILYPARLSILARSILPVFSHMGVRVALLTVTTMCNFERGGATKPMIGSSWNNGVKNCLGLYQVHKRPSMITLIVFCWLWRLLTPLRPCLKHFSIIDFFADTHTYTHTHRHEGIALPLLRMHLQGNTPCNSHTTVPIPYTMCLSHAVA